MNTHSQKSAFNPSYVVQRKYIVPLIPDTSQAVLDVGCSVGVLGRMIKDHIPACKVFGIEISQDMAFEAKRHLDQVFVGDIEQIDVEKLFGGQLFDSIIFADVLEHLKDPWNILKNTTRAMCREGVVIVCLPNICHYSTIFSLVFRGKWPYRERGIHDKTHLRFFALKNIFELLKYAELEAVRIDRRYRIFESMGLGPLNRLSWIFRLPVLSRFFTFQYIVVARKKT